MGFIFNNKGLFGGGKSDKKEKTASDIASSLHEDVDEYYENIADLEGDDPVDAADLAGKKFESVNEQLVQLKLKVSSICSSKRTLNKLDEMIRSAELCSESLENADFDETEEVLGDVKTTLVTIRRGLGRLIGPLLLLEHNTKKKS